MQHQQLLQLLQQQHQLVYNRLNQLHQSQNEIRENIVQSLTLAARAFNRSATRPTDPLQPLPRPFIPLPEPVQDINNPQAEPEIENPPPAFPQLKKDVDLLTAPQVTALLQYYGQDPTGNAAEKKERFKLFIGMYV